MGRARVQIRLVRSILGLKDVFRITTVCLVKECIEFCTPSAIHSPVLNIGSYNSRMILTSSSNTNRAHYCLDLLIRQIGRMRNEA